MPAAGQWPHTWATRTPGRGCRISARSSPVSMSSKARSVHLNAVVFSYRPSDAVPASPVTRSSLFTSTGPGSCGPTAVNKLEYSNLRRCVCVSRYPGKSQMTHKQQGQNSLKGRALSKPDRSRTTLSLEHMATAFANVVHSCLVSSLVSNRCRRALPVFIVAYSPRGLSRVPVSIYIDLISGHLSRWLVVHPLNPSRLSKRKPSLSTVTRTRCAVIAVGCGAPNLAGVMTLLRRRHLSRCNQLKPIRSPSRSSPCPRFRQSRDQPAVSCGDGGDTPLKILGWRAPRNDHEVLHLLIIMRNHACTSIADSPCP